ncbi:hypothetical protein [Georgenia sp. MJ170]|uniref:hypothetical protein n=1 Tax=Georgenia sunbinii TaxID=3117728 RepID=UPI002F266FA1
MDVWQITLATLRRWYIFLPLLALTGVAVYLAGDSVQPEYEVTGTALITPGSAPATVPNPYGGQDQANAAVAIVLNSMETQARIAAEGLAPAYEVSTQSRSTIMNVRVRADDPHVALETGRRVFELAAEELSTRQGAAGVSASSQYGVDVLAEPSVESVVYDGKRKVQAAVAVLGAGLALLVAVLFDDIVGLYRRRRAKRRGRRRDDAEMAEASAPPPNEAHLPERQRDRARL